jgi:protein-L-isoaspartate(D-aspartate) O-methyltransferase
MLRDQCEVRLRASRARLLEALILWLALALLLLSGCGLAEGAGNGGSRSLVQARNAMVERQLAARDIRDERVLEAMRKVRRHRYAPDLEPARAYEDRPHSIGEGQTISQPYIVALMSQLAEVEPPCKVLEVGTGSGYQAAVLAEMGCTVYTIEIVEPLARRARRILESEGYGGRVRTRVGDGYRGWPEQAPFDAVVVTAAAPRVPRPLLEQLREGGRLVIPVGEGWQMLEVHRRTKAGFELEKITSVRFVPMTGEVRRRP